MRYLVPGALLLAATLHAQSVSPTFYARVEGTGSNVFPFGNTTVPFRFSQVHDDVPGMAVTSFAVRANFSATTYAAHSITCDGWMSTAVTTSSNMSATFDNNHGVDKTQVITAHVYNHPASIPNVPAAPFHLVYPLDVPFPFGGIGSLCWEVHVTAKTQTISIPHDAASNSTALNPALVVGRYGTGCIATGRTAALTAIGTSTMNWPGGTGTLTVNGSNAQASGLVLHVLGFNNTNYLGIPLPFELPGTNGAPSGSCFLYNDLVVLTALAASATGTVSSPIAIPATPELNGLTSYSQLWGLLETTNALGITTSNVALHHWAGPNATIPVSRVYLSASLGPVGTVAIGSSVLVTRFN